MKRSSAGRWLILALAVCTGPRPTAAAPNDLMEWERTDEAPIDCWPMPDGCPARTGSCATPVPRGPLERAWSYQPKDGAIAGEPLVWKQLVFVPFEDGFDVLDLETGGMIVSKRNIAKKTSAAPVVGPGFVLARTAPDRLEAFAIDVAAKSARSIWAWKCPLGALTTDPIVKDRDVYVFAGTTAFRLRVGRADPVWTASVPTSAKSDAAAMLDGQPSVLGDYLYVVTRRPVTVEGGGTELIVELDCAALSTGERSTTYVSAAARDGGRSSFAETRITGRSLGEVFILSRSGIQTANGASATTALLPRVYSSPKETRLMSLVQSPVRWKNRWVLVDSDESRAAYLGITIDPYSEEAKNEPPHLGPTLTRYVLSDATRSPHIVDAGVPATAAGDAILVGPFAFEPLTRVVLHELPVKAAFRTVPASRRSGSRTRWRHGRRARSIARARR